MKHSDKSARTSPTEAWAESKRRKARSERPLDDARLARFFGDLQGLVDTHGCFRDTRHAQASIDALALPEAAADALFDWCCAHGGLCDCEISANTFDHWEQCRDRS